MRRIAIVAGVLCVAWGVGRARAGDQVLISHSFDGVPLVDAVREIQQQAGVTVTVDPALQDRTVTVEVLALRWDDAIRVVAQQAEAVLERGAGDSWQVVPMPRVSYGTGPDGVDIREVIDGIATQVRANIVVAPDVTGKIFVQLHDMPWKDALTFAVKSAGDFTVVEEEHGVLRVVRSDSLRAQVETRVFALRYLQPPSDYKGTVSTPYAWKRDYTGNRNDRYKEAETAIADFTLLTALREMLTPDVGFIQYEAGTNSFIVTDVAPKLATIQRILDEMDREPRQAFVDVKFVATENTDFLDFGVDWGNALNTGPIASIAGGSTFTRLPFHPGHDSLFHEYSVRPEGPSGQDIANFIGRNTSTTQPHAYSFGTLNFTQVQAVLRFIRRDVRSRVIQAPQIVAQDNVPATIFVGELIRYAETRASSSEAGTLVFSLAEASASPVSTGFQLMIHPRIVEQDNTIQMTVIPERDSLSGNSTTQEGFDTFTDGTNTIDLPRVSSQTLVSNVTLESGQTVVLGGLLEFSETFEDTRIPLLGDIPILGYAFRNKNRLQTTENLLIFITPRIISSAAESRRALEESLQEREAALRREFGERLRNSAGE